MHREGKRSSRLTKTISHSNFQSVLTADPQPEKSTSPNTYQQETFEMESTKMFYDIGKHLLPLKSVGVIQ
ncbi:hypothetical protein ACXWSI_09055, partial [Streptococcus pyogenes]